MTLRLAEEAAKKALEQKKAKVSSLVEKVCDFYKEYKGDSTPTVVINASELGTEHDQVGLLECLGTELRTRFVPDRYKPKFGQVWYSSQVVADNVSGKPSYKLRIDVTERPEGGHKF